MPAPKWTMKVTTSPNNPTVDFKIVDKHHTDKFYGEWTTSDFDSLSYHIDGVTEMIERGTYHRSEYYYNDSPVSSWEDLIKMMERHLVECEEKNAA